MTAKPQRPSGRPVRDDGSDRAGSAGDGRTAAPAAAAAERVDAAFLRAPGEDDDGYDPYSDRPASPEPLFERDPWG